LEDVLEAAIEVAMKPSFYLLALALVAIPGAAFAQDTAALERRGEMLVTRHCATCHAVGRAGSSPHPQAPPFRTLGQRYPIESLEEALGEGILSGHPDMPEFEFSAPDVGAVIAYLKSIQQR
jgi:mono/diheme cytochrome c family protein